MLLLVAAAASATAQLAGDSSQSRTADDGQQQHLSATPQKPPGSQLVDSIAEAHSQQAAVRMPKSHRHLLQNSDPKANPLNRTDCVKDTTEQPFNAIGRF